MRFIDKLQEWNKGVKRGAPRKLARQLGISESYVSELIKGIRKPSEALRPKIARILGITVQELMAMFSGDRNSWAVHEEHSLYSDFQETIEELCRRMEALESKVDKIMREQDQQKSKWPSKG